MTTEGNAWLYKNKDHGMMSAAASLGTILLWNVEEGLTQVGLLLWRGRGRGEGVLIVMDGRSRKTIEYLTSLLFSGEHQVDRRKITPKQTNETKMKEQNASNVEQHKTNKRTEQVSSNT